MRCTSITLFLSSTLINIHTHSSGACPALRTSDEVAWTRASSPIHLQTKRSTHHNEYDPVAPYGSPKERIRREREVEKKIRRDYSHVDEETKLRIMDLEKKLGEEMRRIDEKFEPKPPQQKNSFRVFLRKLGPQPRGRRRRKRKRNVHEPDPKPPRVFVRVHEPAETAPSDNDDSPPPVVYAPPVPEETYPPPGKPQPGPRKAPGRVLPSAQTSSSSSSQETIQNVSTASDDSDYRNRRLYRKKRRTRFRNNWDDEPIRRVHVLVKGSPSSELKNVSADERKSDSSDEDHVRQVHLMNDFSRPPEARRRRPVVRTKGNAPRPLINRQSSGPVRVVM